MKMDPDKKKVHEAPSTPPPSGSGPLRTRRRRWLAAAAVGLVVIVVWRHAKAAKDGAAAAKKAAAGQTVPVAVAAATRGEIPVYLDGLGSVAAYYTVNLHSRVDGQLMTVLAHEGQFVKQGDILAEIDPRPFQAQLEQAQGQLAKDQALLTNAKLDLERYKTLVEDKAIPRQQYDTQVATLAQYEGTVKADQANVAAARLNVTYAKVTAPISGRVGLRQVDPGNIIHANDLNGMFVITQLQPIAVIFTLPEDALPAVLQKLHGGSKLPVETFNRDKTKKLATGALLTVDNEIDPNSGTAKLKALFDNKDEALFPNQFVNVRLLLETRRDQVLIPSAALQRGAQGQFVYVASPDGTAQMRPVKLGPVDGDNTSVESGVEAGESVVVDGAEKLQPGAKLQIQTPAARGAAPGKTQAPSTEDHRAKP